MKSRRCPQWVRQNAHLRRFNALEVPKNWVSAAEFCLLQSWQESLWQSLSFLIPWLFLSPCLVFLDCWPSPSPVMSKCEFNSVLAWTEEIGVSELPAPSSSGCPKGWQRAPAFKLYRRNDRGAASASFESWNTDFTHTHTLIELSVVCNTHCKDVHSPDMKRHDREARKKSKAKNWPRERSRNAHLQRRNQSGVTPGAVPTWQMDTCIHVAISVMHEKGKVMGLQQVPYEHAWRTWK